MASATAEFTLNEDAQSKLATAEFTVNKGLQSKLPFSAMAKFRVN